MQIETFPLSKEDIQQMLDLTYELEGLLHLSVNREESTPSRLMPLMKSKIVAISVLMDKNAEVSAEDAPVSSPDDDAAGFSYAIPDDDDEQKEERRTADDMEDTSLTGHESAEADALQPDVPTDVAEDRQPMEPTAATVVMDDAADAPETAMPAEIPDSEEPAYNPDRQEMSGMRDESDDDGDGDDGSDTLYDAENDDESDDADDTKDTDNVEDAHDEEDAYDAVLTGEYVYDGVADETEEPAGRPEESRPAAASQPRHKAPVFSINDRFLYSRELFGGKVADFESALKDVAGMESYEEAEEYFYTEWNLDPESPIVHGFLEVIANYFS